MSRIGPGRVSADQSSESAASTPVAELALIPSYTLAGLPAAGTAGRMARVTDVLPNVRVDDGGAWRALLDDESPVVTSHAGPHAIGGVTVAGEGLTLYGVDPVRALIIRESGIDFNTAIPVANFRFANTAGTPAAGIGTRFAFILPNAGSSFGNRAFLDVVMSDVTEASEDTNFRFYTQQAGSGSPVLTGEFGLLTSDQGGHGLRLPALAGSTQPLELRGSKFSTIRMNEEQMEIVLGTLGGVGVANANLAVVPRDSVVGAKFEVRNGGDTKGVLLTYAVGAGENVAGVGTNTADPLVFFTTNLTSERMRLAAGGILSLGTTAATGQLVVDQASTTAAIPVLSLEQRDIDQDWFEFDTTIGVGNATEAVGAKVLTTTHFLKVEITGVGARYIPVGTIA